MAPEATINPLRSGVTGEGCRAPNSRPTRGRRGRRRAALEELRVLLYVGVRRCSRSSSPSTRLRGRVAATMGVFSLLRVLDLEVVVAAADRPTQFRFLHTLP